MLRLISLILLLVMLPRCAMAMPAGAELCIADSHIRVDCHTETSAGCDGETDSTPSEHASDVSEPESCIDLPGGGFDARVSAAKSLDAFIPSIVALTELAFIAPVQPVATPPDHPDNPPSFCARTHSCSIALRC